MFFFRRKVFLLSPKAPELFQIFCKPYFFLKTQCGSNFSQVLTYPSGHFLQLLLLFLQSPKYVNAASHGTTFDMSTFIFYFFTFEFGLLAFHVTTFYSSPLKEGINFQDANLAYCCIVLAMQLSLLVASRNIKRGFHEA